MKDAGRFLVLAGILLLMTFGNVFAQDEWCPTNLTSPVKGTVGYTFISDYMFRGLNMSDILGNQVGRGAHELTYGLSLDLAELGIEDVGDIGVTVKQAYLAKYAGTNANLAKTDIALSLTHPCPFGTLTFEWRNYKWSNSPYSGGNEATAEVVLGLAVKDGELIETLTGEDMGENVLNPKVTWIIDYDLADGGQLWLFDLSHPFDLGQVGPELAGVTLTPTWTLAVDNRYYGSYVRNLTGGALSRKDTTRFAYMEYGVNAGADLTEVLGLTCGRLGVKGGVAFVHTFEKLHASVLNDTLYSYVSLVYNW